MGCGELKDQITSVIDCFPKDNGKLYGTILDTERLAMDIVRALGLPKDMLSKGEECNAKSVERYLEERVNDDKGTGRR